MKGKTAEEILKEIGYDNNSITETEKWIAKELYKKYAQQFASQSSDKEERDPDVDSIIEIFKESFVKVEVLEEGDSFLTWCDSPDNVLSWLKGLSLKELTNKDFKSIRKKVLFMIEMNDCLVKYKHGNEHCILREQYESLADDIMNTLYFSPPKESEGKELSEITEWINVKDRKPKERYLDVLVFNGDAPKYNQCVRQASWFSENGGKFILKGNEKLLGTTTHWMKTPNYPTT